MEHVGEGAGNGVGKQHPVGRQESGRDSPGGGVTQEDGNAAGAATRNGRDGSRRTERFNAASPRGSPDA